MALFTTIVASLFAISLIDSAIYIGDSNSKSWSNAKSACESLSTSSSAITIRGQLATWSSTNDYSALKIINDALGGGSTWIGLSDLSGEGNWKFVDNDESYCLQSSGAGVCDSLPQWNPGEPNDSNGNEDCAEVYDSSYLNDNVCSNGNSFICEIIITGSTSVASSMDFPNNPIVNSPFSSPSDNIYIFEFSSNKDIAFFASVLLNVVFVVCICYVMIKAKESKRSVYAKVVDIDDETQEER